VRIGRAATAHRRPAEPPGEPGGGAASTDRL